MDEHTNPQYVIGGLLCHSLLQKGGIDLLKKAMQQTATDDELIRFLRASELYKTDLNAYLRHSVAELARSPTFRPVKVGR